MIMSRGWGMNCPTCGRELLRYDRTGDPADGIIYVCPTDGTVNAEDILRPDPQDDLFTDPDEKVQKQKGRHPGAGRPGSVDRATFIAHLQANAEHYEAVIQWMAARMESLDEEIATVTRLVEEGIMTDDEANETRARLAGEKDLIEESLGFHKRELETTNEMIAEFSKYLR